ncbi:helix-turn-helix transcriptional regulator [Desulfosporosinus sp. OT]|uniref:helix-turn-helix domain-containing protein n=1 Tax=Desulfosporosinus sp. OT TaxID=913865 RepID=UPI000223AE3B|nr:helix-turn-helix transcriptional regulator [Desulfosporosinus sp. OT]EGW36874.1 hypothetical protein DOT_5259 [Desulfosporosinus sp. OT]
MELSLGISLELKLQQAYGHINDGELPASCLEGLNKLLVEKKLSRKDIIAKSKISDNSFDQYVRGGRNPGRDVVLKLCLGMGASINETNRLLELAGRNRLGTNSDGRDNIIAYCLLPADSGHRATRRNMLVGCHFLLSFRVGSRSKELSSPQDIGGVEIGWINNIYSCCTVLCYCFYMNSNICITQEIALTFCRPLYLGRDVT